MALSELDKMMLNSQQQIDILMLTAQYDAAKKVGNTALMAEVHAKANAIRVTSGDLSSEAQKGMTPADIQAFAKKSQQTYLALPVAVTSQGASSTVTKASVASGDASVVRPSGSAAIGSGVDTASNQVPSVQASVAVPEQVQVATYEGAIIPAPITSNLSTIGKALLVVLALGAIAGIFKK